MVNNLLYPCFNSWKGNIWFIADTHFNDKEIESVRNLSSDTLVKMINKKAGKSDTLVLLGDVGDIKYVSKLKAGYKVLILGNHDKGTSNYIRKITLVKRNYNICPKCRKQVVYDFSSLDFFGCEAAWCPECFDIVFPVSNEFDDNHLFDEVYDGALMIRDNIVLSHEPVDFIYAFNIHGHDHNGNDFKKYVLKDYDADMSINDMSTNYLNTIKTYKLTKLNVCADWVGYYPVSLKEIMKSGVLKNIKNIHRVAIDKAKERKDN